jgi:hypothetical protein
MHFFIYFGSIFSELLLLSSFFSMLQVTSRSCTWFVGRLCNCLFFPVMLSSYGVPAEKAISTTDPEGIRKWVSLRTEFF